MGPKLGQPYGVSLKRVFRFENVSLLFCRCTDRNSRCTLDIVHIQKQDPSKYILVGVILIHTNLSILRYIYKDKCL